MPDAGISELYSDITEEELSRLTPEALKEKEERLQRQIENLKSQESDYKASLSGFSDGAGSVLGLLAAVPGCFPQFRIEQIKPVFYAILEQINYVFGGTPVLTDPTIKEKLDQWAYDLVPLGSIALGFAAGYLAGYFSGGYVFRRVYGEPEREGEILRLEGVCDRLERMKEGRK